MSDTKPTATIPDDPSELKQLVKELIVQNQALQELLQAKDLDLERLKHQLRIQLRQAYGKSAETPKAQMLMEFMIQHGLLEAENKKEPEVQGTDPENKKPRNGNGHGRRPLPEHLPVERHEYDLAEADRSCSKCDCELTKIGEEITEQLEYVPAHYKRIQHVRFKYACRQCQDEIKLAAKPEQVIDKGLAGPGLLAYVVVSKYADHLPLHRLEQIIRRTGVDINRSTLCDWIRQLEPLLAPLYNALCQDVLRSRVIHSDDTVTPVLDPNKDRTRQGRIWTYVGDKDHPQTVYVFTPNRAREGPQGFLRDFVGYLQADAYPGYNDLFRDGTIHEVACWAHARRKFFDAQGSDSVRALTALAYIKRLYKIEQKAADLSDEERCALRQERARPILEEFKTWMTNQFNPIIPGAVPVLPKSPMGEALSYSLNLWDALCRYTDHGWLNIDNNAAERALRHVVVGRKNWMHVGSDQGGHWAAVFFTLIECCKRAGKEPFAYIKDILPRLRSCPEDKIHELFPVNWIPVSD